VIGRAKSFLIHNREQAAAAKQCIVRSSRPMRTSSPTMAVPFSSIYPYPCAFWLRGIISHQEENFRSEWDAKRRRQSKVLRRRMKDCSLKSRDSRPVPNKTGFYSIPKEICHQTCQPSLNPEICKLIREAQLLSLPPPARPKAPRESLRIHSVQVDSRRELRSRVFHPVATASL
jgi:hypothetical protein